MSGELSGAFPILAAGDWLVVAFDGEHIILRWRQSEEICYRISTGRRARVGQFTRARTDDSEPEPLLIVDQATKELRRAANAGGVSFVSIRDESCVISKRRWPSESSSAPSNATLFALIRFLLSSSKPIRQGRSGVVARRPRSSEANTLSTLLQVTQSHVSELMQQLPSGSVTDVDDGWVVREFEVLWDWHLANYVGTGGARVTLQSPHLRATQLENLRRAAGTAAEKLGHGREAARILDSGYQAYPTLIASHEPRSSITRRQSSEADTWGPVTILSRFLSTTLTEAGYEPCSPLDATAQLIVPDDRSIYETAAAWGNAKRTDPLITAWEVAQGPSSSRPQVLALRDWAKNYASTH